MLLLPGYGAAAAWLEKQEPEAEKQEGVTAGGETQTVPPPAPADTAALPPNFRGAMVLQQIFRETLPKLQFVLVGNKLLFSGAKSDIEMAQRVIAAVAQDLDVLSVVTKPPEVLGTFSVILTETPRQLEAARLLLSQIDVPPPQVLIEARLLELSPEATERLGIHWADAAGAISSFTITETPLERNSVVRFGTFARSGLEFQAILKALIAEGRARLLASPSITVVNEQEAEIFIGDQIQYLGVQDTDDRGRAIIQVLSQKVGVNLIAKPVVHLGDQAVTMRLVPAVSTLIQFVPVPGGGDLPQVRTRLADTTVRLNDGEMLAIGGLISEEEVRHMQKVPLLGDLPLIGQLFRNRVNSRRRTELAILISPRIILGKHPIPQPIFNGEPRLPPDRPFPKSP